MKKEITGREAVELIEEAEAVILTDQWQALVYPSIEQNGEDFWNVDCSYEDSDGLEYEYSFKIWADDVIEVKDNQLFLQDGDYTQDYVGIKLLEVKQL